MSHWKCQVVEFGRMQSEANIDQTMSVEIGIGMRTGSCWNCWWNDGWRLGGTFNDAVTISTGSFVVLRTRVSFILGISRYLRSIDKALQEALTISVKSSVTVDLTEVDVVKVTTLLNGVRFTANAVSLVANLRTKQN